MQGDLKLVNINDERFWDILFDEACVEGQQATRIRNELEKIIAYDVEKVVEETDKVLADLNVVEVLSHFEPDKTIQMPLSNFLCAFKDEIGRLIRNGGKE